MRTRLLITSGISWSTEGEIYYNKLVLVFLLTHKILYNIIGQKCYNIAAQLRIEKKFNMLFVSYVVNYNKHSSL